MRHSFLTISIILYSLNTLILSSQLNVYYFINLKNYDASLYETYKEKLCNYSAYTEEILNFNGQEKLFNYFAFKEPFLKSIFSRYNLILINSFDNLQNVKFIITEEVPREDEQLNLLLKYPYDKRILFSYETLISNPRSHMQKYLNYYRHVFTWNQDFIDNKKIHYLPAWIIWTDIMPMIDNRPSFDEKKFCTLVASYWMSNHEYSNHINRMNMIECMMQRMNTELDIYGTGWATTKFPNYKGRISFNGNRRLNKINTIKNYKFYLCYENTKNVHGYITEKIFECFAAGCVPIYSGAKNIRDYIPQNCFIDAQDFIHNEALYDFLLSMDKNTYELYIKNIQNFLVSKMAQKYSRAHYKTKIQHILHITKK